MEFRHLVSYAVSFLMLVQQTSWAAVQVNSAIEPSYEAQIAQIEKFMASAERIRQRLDRSSFDLDALLDSLDFDSLQILEFVKDEIAFEQYPGTLRGAEGTLMSRAGNSLDQSVLLARLLKDAGYEARIAQGRLNADQVAALLQEMSQPRTPRSALEVDSTLAHELSALGLPVDLVTPEKEDESSGTAGVASDQSHPVFEALSQTYGNLANQLEMNGLSLGSLTFSNLADEARDYFWVQFRDTAAGAWVDYHPAFTSAAEPEVEVVRVFQESVPQDLQHTLTVQVFIERSVGNKLESVALSEPWTRPTANLNAVPLVFSNVPDTLLSSNSLAVDLPKAIANAHWFAPTLDGESIGAKYFDLHGNLIDPMAASAAASGLVQTVGRLFGEALGEVGDGSAPTLTAQWLQFGLSSPDGGTREYRRYTFDLIGSDVRRSNQLPEEFTPTTPLQAYGLTQRHTFMVSNGETPRSMGVEFVLDSLLRSKPMMVRLLDELWGRVPQDDATWDSSQTANYWNGHLALFSEMDAAGNLGGTHRTYRSGPSLVIQREGLDSNKAAVQSIDIVQNPRRPLPGGDGGMTLRLESVVMAGIWETRIEGILIGPSNTLYNTMSVFEAARSKNIDLKVFPPGSLLDNNLYAPSTVADMQADLDRGFAVIAPAVQPGDRPAWWRINPETGETLGQIEGGRGAGEAVKYLSVATLGFSIAMLAISLVGCKGDYQPSLMDEDPTISQYNAMERGELVCCTLWSIMAFVIGLMAGGVGAAPVGQAAHNAAQASVTWDLISYFVPNPICSSYDSGDP